MRTFQLSIATQRRISLTAAPTAHSLAFGCAADCDVWAKDLNMAYAGKSLVYAFPHYPVRSACFTIGAVALSVLPFSSPASAYESASGPRVRGLGVVSAPVDRLGPTLRPDPLITPDSGWMSSGSAGAAGSGRSPGLPSLFPPAAQPVQVFVPAGPGATPGTAKAKKSGKSRGRIILQKPNG